VLDGTTSDHLPYRGIDSEPIGIVGIFIAGETGKDRLPELGTQKVASILAVSVVLKALFRDVGKTKGVVEFTIG
jgi:hypothetical protein